MDEQTKTPDAPAQGTPSTTPDAKAAPAAAPAGTPQGTTPDVKAGEQDKGQTKPPEGQTPAPEEFVPSLPKDVQIDAAALEKYKVLVKEQGLSAKAAQALLDFQLGITQEASKAAAEAQKAAVAAYEADCIKALKADKEFGANFDVNMEIAKKAVVKFGDDALIKELQAMGLGSHPGLVKMFHRIGKAISEDSTTLPRGTGPEVRDAEQQLRERYNHPTSAQMFPG